MAPRVEIVEYWKEEIPHTTAAGTQGGVPLTHTWIETLEKIVAKVGICRQVKEFYRNLSMSDYWLDTNGVPCSQEFSALLDGKLKIRYIKSKLKPESIAWRRLGGVESQND